MESTSTTYQYQHSLHRKTRNALLTTALSLIEEKGLSQTNMIEIADRARVSRASLYNHFRDKNEVFLAVAEMELERILQLAMREREVAARLAIISRELSSHGALQMAVVKDPALIAQTLAKHDESSHRMARFRWRELKILLSSHRPWQSTMALSGRRSIKASLQRSPLILLELL